MHFTGGQIKAVLTQPGKDVDAVLQLKFNLSNSATWRGGKKNIISYVSLVHALLSLQLITVFAQPVVGLQVSLVQALRSSQLLRTLEHPVAGLQESTVQALLSSQAGTKVRGLQSK